VVGLSMTRRRLVDRWRVVPPIALPGDALRDDAHQRHAGELGRLRAGEAILRTSLSGKVMEKLIMDKLAQWWSALHKGEGASYLQRNDPGTILPVRRRNPTTQEG